MQNADYVEVRSIYSSKASAKLHLMQEAYTLVPRITNRKEADSSGSTWGAESEGKATKPKKTQRRKQLEALQLGLKEAKRSDVDLLRPAE